MQQQNLKILVLAKQVPDTRNVGKDAMTPEGTVNRAALPAIFNPEDLNGIERKLGALFPQIFLSITCDNGTEFSDAEGIENKRRGKGKRTTVYYCHPYTPSERGTNENQNGLIRRLVPKGTDLGTLSPQEVKAAEAWLNSYPRKMFGFLCSEQLFREELALILAR